MAVTNPEPDAIASEELWDLLKKVCPKLAQESVGAYQAFADAAFTGLSIRRLVAHYKEVAHLIQESYDATNLKRPPTVRLNTLMRWSKDYFWQRRLKDWKPIHEAYRRKQWSDRERTLLERWNKNRHRLLDGVEKMLDKADLLVKHPHIQKVVNKQVVAEFAGQVIETQTVIAPTKWGLRDVAAFYKVGCELMVDVVGDRQIMIDRLHADGFIITDPSAGQEEADIEKFLAAAQTVEEFEF
jgi:hypothetical protein